MREGVVSEFMACIVEEHGDSAETLGEFPDEEECSLNVIVFAVESGDEFLHTGFAWAVVKCEDDFLDEWIT